MARSFMPLFSGVTFVLCQIVVSKAAGYCQDNLPVVHMCSANSAESAYSVYLDNQNAPLLEKSTCLCTLDIANGNQSLTVQVRQMRIYTTDVDIFINNNKVFSSLQDLKYFDYSHGMVIRFETSGGNKQQCYKFDIIVSPSSPEIGITVTCSKPDIRVPQTTTSVPTKPAMTTGGKQDVTTGRKLDVTTDRKLDVTTELSQMKTTIHRKTEPTTYGIQTDAEPNTIGIVLGAAAGVVVVLAVIAVIIVFLWRRQRNVSRKPTEQDQSVDTYYNVAYQAGTNESTHNPLPNEYVNMRQSSDLNPPATYESLQTHDQREDDHSYQTVIAGGDGEYVNADYEEPITNDESTNYTTLQQPTEQEHVYKTIH